MGKANGQKPIWKGDRYVYEPISGAPQSNPVTSQTAPGTNEVQADLLRRQGAANPFQISTSPLSAPTTIAYDPAKNLQAAGAQGAGGFAGTGALTGPRASITGTKPVAAAGNVDVSAGTRPNGAPTPVQNAANNAKDALGPAPTVDMGLADRGKSTVNDALGLSRQVVDASLAPVDQTGLTQAVGDARKVLDQLLNGPSTAAAIGAQTLRSQLALARSAAGGPGAVQNALQAAQQQAPELQGQATQAAVQENLARQSAAGQLAGGLATTELGAQQNVTQRLNAASQASSGYAQGALGSSGQDIAIAQSNQGAATALLNNVSQLTGVQLDIDQRQQELIGQMARDMNAMNYNWAALDAETQNKEFDRWVQVYGIDQAAAAQIKAASIANHKGPMDYIVPIIGAIATVGASAAGKK
jgi:hypothetical protein